MYDFVYIENTGQTPLTIHMRGNRKLVIQPGGKEIVDFATAAANFGHPKERDYPKNRARTEAYKLLRQFWGFHSGFDTETEAERPAGHLYSSWEAKRPDFRVTTIDGQWIPMILDDPDGILPLPTEGGALDHETAVSSGIPRVMEQTMAMMQKQIEALQAQLAAQAGPTQPVQQPISGEPQQSAVAVMAPPIEDTVIPEPPADEAPPTTDQPRTVRSRT